MIDPDMTAHDLVSEPIGEPSTSAEEIAHAAVNAAAEASADAVAEAVAEAVVASVKGKLGNCWSTLYPDLLDDIEAEAYVAAKGTLSSIWSIHWL